MNISSRLLAWPAKDTGAYTHAQTHSCTHTNTQTCKHTCPHKPQAQSTHAYRHAYACLQAQEQARAQTDAHARTHAHARMHALFNSTGETFTAKSCQSKYASMYSQYSSGPVPCLILLLFPFCRKKEVEVCLSPATPSGPKQLPQTPSQLPRSTLHTKASVYKLQLVHVSTILHPVCSTHHASLQGAQTVCTCLV